ncbi:decarboxylase, UbiD family [Leptospira inadai serovar Lyme str. 10]|uniref:Decarboxylase, UbiD family n=2 Tax=Leptospira inadai serovar Lyme TaxID=293084 RepID=V6HA60_9LEPT|nr:UbiD family decarboxylase [Leptospira inadai]EQA36221.1 decarboxylase, UbiD family [Leptospira inadai serovar Lyme str. 10]PNV74876.1 4-hydroxybenzoate decarboxylase [Leptospira inadai serovar Lyme]
MNIRSTGDFLRELSRQNELLEIADPIDPILELAELQRRVVAKRGPALLFRNVIGSKIPVATNLYGSKKRIRIAFGEDPERFVQRIAYSAKHLLPPTFGKVWELRSLAWAALKIGLRKISSPAVLEIEEESLDALPAIKSWPKDAGRFITLPLVYTESPSTGKGNLGMYRIQFHGPKQTGMHIQIHRGGGFHYHEAEKKGQALPAHIYVGGPPALTIAAVAPLPEEISEFLLASLLLGERLRISGKPPVSPLPIIADADFALIGKIPPKIRKPEGPFGDHYGYYALKHDYPVFEVDRIFRRKDAVWPATVVGRPPQEDHWIAEYLQDLLSPLFPLVMPQVKGVWAYEESGVHSLAAAIVQERYGKEAFMGALRILGEGQLSLTKVLMVTDQEVELKDFKKVFSTILERFDPETDLHIFSNIAQDTLDYTGPKVNEGSKAVFLGVGNKLRKLKSKIDVSFKNSKFKKPKVYCPGALVVSGTPYKRGDKLAELLLKESAIREFTFVFLVDDSEEATASDHDFIWNIFTRFEPAADIYGNFQVRRNHLSFSSPVVIDARLKDWYPDVLEPDPKIAKRVEDRFGGLLSSL